MLLLFLPLPCRKQDNIPHTSCDDCPQGHHATSSSSDECTKCSQGNYQDQRKQQDCLKCPSGRYGDQQGLVKCDLCGNAANPLPRNNQPTLSYQNQLGKSWCELCVGGKVATTSKTGCNTCSVEKGLDSYKDASAQCQYCQGCNVGHYKDTCDATSSCTSCIVGRYKASSEIDSNSVVNKGKDWNKLCEPCSACPIGTYRDDGNSCRSKSAIEDGVAKCQPCPTNTFKSSTGNWDDKCIACVQCPLGETRTGCASSHSGDCTSWETPTITDVGGTGKKSGSTEGNDVLNIYGKFFGPVRSKSAASDVVVRYGSYIAKDCSVVKNDVGLKSQNIAGNTGHIRCSTVAGVGKDFSISVQIGAVGKEKTSESYNAGISYQAPIVADYKNAAGLNFLANTNGGQVIIVKGANFGPMGTVIEKAVYGELGIYEMAASDCVVTVQHKEIQCKTGPGAGVGHKMVLTIGGQVILVILDLIFLLI